MAQSMKPSGASFTVTQIFPEVGEILNAAWARALAGNTGWLARQYRVLCHMGTAIGNEVAVYLESGVYDVRAYAAGGAQTVTLEGDTIISAATGEGVLTAWTTGGGWMTATTDATGGETASIMIRRQCS